MNQHTKPCKECPFKRSSRRGWLGASTPQQFADVAMSEVRMPCHMLVNYEQKEKAWRAEAANAPQCAGRAVFWTNQCKSARDKSLLFLPANRRQVFINVAEFLAHHLPQLNRKRA